MSLVITFLIGVFLAFCGFIAYVVCLEHRSPTPVPYSIEWIRRRAEQEDEEENEDDS